MLLLLLFLIFCFSEFKSSIKTVKNKDKLAESDEEDESGDDEDSGSEDDNAEEEEQRSSEDGKLWKSKVYKLSSLSS